MRFLIVPENNSLSHLGKALALEASLSALGHEVFVAAGRQRAPFLRRLGERGRILPDIQENDPVGYPTAEWFRDPRHFAECIRAEVALLEELRPDRALGVFRFTLKASARLAGVPYDSLACGCMLPETPEVLGFPEGHPGLALQQESLKRFFGFAAARASRALESAGLKGIGDIREMLKGDRTFLWDFPAFSLLPERPGVTHVGPIPWRGWPHDGLDLDEVLSGPRPLAVLTFGTCVGSSEVALRMVRLLRSQGYRVLLAAGGQEELRAAVAGEPHVIACRFAPLHLILPHAAIVACHGGQLTVFEALAHRVPVLVMPFQAEQAHNGVCLERMGCGRRLGAFRQFMAASRVYVDAFGAMGDVEILGIVRELVESPQTAACLASAQEMLSRYHGLETLTSLLVESSR